MLHLNTLHPFLEVPFAFRKKSGSLPPILIEYYWGRLASDCANAVALRVAADLAKVLVGVRQHVSEVGPQQGSFGFIYDLPLIAV